MREKILVIDDDKVILDLTALVLRSKDFQVFLADSARQGYTIIEQQQPAVVLLDYMMPEVDGMAALREIRHRFPETYVIMFTGKGSEEIAVALMKAGAADYIPKPFSNTNLVERIENVLRLRGIELRNIELLEERERLRSEIESWNRELEQRVEQKSAELESAHAEILQSEKLAAMGHLSAGLAHEIRNPLASISGSVQLLLENVPAQGEEQRLMRIVVNEADRLNGLLSDFLTFARPRPPQKTDFDLPQLLQEFIDLLHQDQRFSAIQVDTDWPSACRLNADLEQLKQSLWDLAINAAEAMQGQGTLLFQVVVDDTISIIVEDSGPGISADVKARIFEPFFSTKEQGTGLGLASVYVAMEAHNGQLTVTDGSQGGACFQLSFPHREGDE